MWLLPLVSCKTAACITSRKRISCQIHTSVRKHIAETDTMPLWREEKTTYAAFVHLPKYFGLYSASSEDLSVMLLTTPSYDFSPPLAPSHFNLAKKSPRTAQCTLAFISIPSYIFTGFYQCDSRIENINVIWDGKQNQIHRCPGTCPLGRRRAPFLPKGEVAAEQSCRSGRVSSAGRPCRSWPAGSGQSLRAPFSWAQHQAESSAFGPRAPRPPPLSRSSLPGQRNPPGSTPSNTGVHPLPSAPMSRAVAPAAPRCPHRPLRRRPDRYRPVRGAGAAGQRVPQRAGCRPSDLTAHRRRRATFAPRSPVRYLRAPLAPPLLQLVRGVVPVVSHFASLGDPQDRKGSSERSERGTTQRDCARYQRGGSASEVTPRGATAATATTAPCSTSG